MSASDSNSPKGEDPTILAGSGVTRQAKDTESSIEKTVRVPAASRGWRRPRSPSPSPTSTASCTAT